MKTTCSSGCRYTRSDLALLLSAGFCIARGWSYVPLRERDLLPHGVERISQSVGIYPWVAAWMIIGLYMIICALWRQHRKYLAWAGFSGMMMGWAFAYLYGVLCSAYPFACFPNGGHAGGGDFQLMVRDVMRFCEYLYAGLVVAFLSAEKHPGSLEGGDGQ